MKNTPRGNILKISNQSTGLQWVGAGGLSGKILRNSNCRAKLVGAGGGWVCPENPYTAAHYLCTHIYIHNNKHALTKMAAVASTSLAFKPSLAIGRGQRERSQRRRHPIIVSTRIVKHKSSPGERIAFLGFYRHVDLSWRSLPRPNVDTDVCVVPPRPLPSVLAPSVWR